MVGAADFLFLRLVYVDGFVRLSEIPFSLALVRIAYGERPSLSPMILRGLFCFANFLSCEMSSFVQGLPTFLVDLVISISSRMIITEPFADKDDHGRYPRFRFFDSFRNSELGT